MPNAVKYKTGNLTGSLQKGNVALGISGSLGPTSTTGWYNGPNPVAGKYQIFETTVSGDPEVYSPQDDAELIKFARWKGATGADTGSVAAVLAWIGTQTNLMAANFEYPTIVTDGLVLNLDAGFVGSYPTINNTWYDLSGNANNGTLTNGPTFNSANSGSIVFDKVDDRVQRNALNVGNNFTIGIWCKPTSATRQTMMSNSYTYQVLENTEGFLFNIGNAGTDMFISLGRDLYGRISPTGLISANTWFYACASYNGSTINLYFNGANVGGNFFGSPINVTYNSNPFFLGGWNNGSNPYGDFFGGNIAIAQMYNRALSATEITQNFNAQKARFGL
jgi:hypothetical protein